MNSKRILSLKILFVFLALMTPIVGATKLGFFDPIQKPMNIELIDVFFPEKIDTDDSDWKTLPFGYTLGPWPKKFASTPIVMKMTYHKGPPDQFIQNMVQVWNPIEAELILEGPRTPKKKLTSNEWQICFTHRWNCKNDKKIFYDLYVADLKKWLGQSQDGVFQFNWFETQNLMGVRGVHVRIELQSLQLDRYIVLTDSGVAQSFTLKTTKNRMGTQARDLFLKTLGGIRVSDDLNNARAWSTDQIKRVNLKSIERTPSTLMKIEKMIEVQNLLYSALSVNPTQPEAFFHLAGVTHLLGIQLLKLPDNSPGIQESWITHIQPTLKNCLKFVQDFPANEKRKQLEINIESLLQDILVIEKNLSVGR